MTTTDTRAALEAAIDAYAQAAIDSGSILGAPYDGPTLSAAWCAVALEVENHVEAEVARRLAAAPDVEVAIVDYALAAQGDFDTSEERDALRAAFAADKARAVEGMRPVGANDDETLAATGDTAARAALLAALTGEVAP